MCYIHASICYTDTKSCYTDKQAYTSTCYTKTHLNAINGHTETSHIDGHRRTQTVYTQTRARPSPTDTHKYVGLKLGHTQTQKQTRNPLTDSDETHTKQKFVLL